MFLFDKKYICIHFFLLGIRELAIMQFIATTVDNKDL